MWNYNLDEMPKDGTEIVVWFVSDSLINETEEYETFVLTLIYHKGMWLKKMSKTRCENLEYAKCWTFAPKDPIALVVDWFDHEYPEAASAHSASYWEGLIAIRDRIDFKLSQHGRKEPEVAVSDEKVAEKVCATCARHKHGYGAVCLICGRGLAND